MKKFLLLLGALSISLLLYSKYCASSISFSLLSLALPALGSSWIGLLIIATSLMSKIYIKSMHTTFIMNVLKLFYLPTLAASSYWINATYRNAMALVALLCVGLFCMHPVGWAAAPYALFWTIPAIMTFLVRPCALGHCLSSTFVAHAIGSILFLYAHPMCAEYWINLIPCVIIERALSVVLMLCALAVQNFVYNLYAQHNLTVQIAFAWLAKKHKTLSARYLY